jgi:hypothetical protein
MFTPGRHSLNQSVEDAMKLWKKLAMASVISAVVGFTLVPNGTVVAKDKANSADTKATVTKRGEADPNIKKEVTENDPKAPATAPVSKGGTKKRGGYSSSIHVDNRTGWIVKIYANGDFVGSVSPYGDTYFPATAGSFNLYARADFTDGTVYTWGPRSTSLDPGDAFTWHITN